MACASKTNKMANNSVDSRVKKVGISIGLAIKVHKKTRNMESKLLLGDVTDVTELKRGLCW